MGRRRSSWETISAGLKLKTCLMASPIFSSGAFPYRNNRRKYSSGEDTRLRKRLESPLGQPIRRRRRLAPTAHVGSGTVNLAGILAGEGASTVSSPTSVSVDDDFTTGQAGISLRSSNHKPPGRVDQVLSGIIDELGRQGRLMISEMIKLRMVSLSASAAAGWIPRRFRSRPSARLRT